MNLKQALGFLLLFTGLVVAIAGYSRTSSETVTKRINGTEVVLDNSASNSANWQAWLGFMFAGMGIATLAFPSPESIKNTQ